MAEQQQNKILFEGKHVRLVNRGGWESVERRDIFGIVSILAITNDLKIVLVEQFRPPVQNRVIELPAGLAGDCPNYKKESLQSAAERELLEETGYEAENICCLTEGPPSAGIVSEIVTFFKATNLKKVAKGGGDNYEDITVHEVPIDQAENWLQGKQREGILIDPKVYLGLFFATQDYLTATSPNN